ncbi:MAG: AMP-dependent synthetase/ligase [Candidatus Nanopelagicales bacterium]|nr:AMP-dependent synthetase/ligase [Candidatus Nanopelagicales bacterium]MDZ4249774.1 AMP-dependent synthetase/ligase [Candidatus Nanopelagicales bacterium]
MREYSESAIVKAPTTGNLTIHILENERDAPDHPAIMRLISGSWRGMPMRQFADEIRALAKGIIASGVQPGDRVCIMSKTRYEWTLANYALWFAGAVMVPIYDTSSAEQVEWILSDSGAVGVFLETDRHREVFDQVSAGLPSVTRVWMIDDGALDDLTQSGVEVSDEDLEARRSSLQPDSVATIIYTSGTTGRPKGCALSHSNFMFEIDAVVNGLPGVFTKESSTLLFLPLAHVFGLLIQLGCVRSQVSLGHTSDIKNLVQSLGTFHPTFLLSVPRVFEKVYNMAQQKAEAGGKAGIFDAAASTAIDYSRAMDTGGPGLVLKLKHALFDKLVYGKLRAALGGQVTYAVSGGAPLGERLGHFFRGLGVTVLEGYGLTETTGASTVNRPDQVKPGTVGKPLPGSSARIADDGEVLLAGPQIFLDYWNNEAATSEAMDKDGWFHSGDIGTIDDEGFVRITGRKKELIVTAGGKNVAPAVLEDRLRAHSLVSQCMVVGDAQPFIACLVTLDAESLPAWLEQRGKPADTPANDLVGDKEIQDAIQEAVDDANKAVSKAEAIKKFTVLPVDWTEEGGQLTPSLKLKRNVVLEEFAGAIVELYS